LAKNWTEEVFEECGAILKGHFVLASGRHSGTYLEKALIYTNPAIVSDLCYNLAVDISRIYSFISASGRIEAVVGPAQGGIALSQWLAHHLSFFYSDEVLALFTEKDKEGKQVLKRGYQKLVFRKNVLVVDDILTTGGSCRQVIEQVQQAGGRVTGIAVLCNRGRINFLKGVPIISSWRAEIEDWEEKDCPLCRAGVPINTERGHGIEYLTKSS
jgi:orotate phosphoribosyltransferase